MACSLDLCGPLFIFPLRVRGRRSDDSQVKTETGVVYNGSPRIEDAIICTQAYIIIAGILYYIDIGLIFIRCLHFICFHGRKGIMR